MSLKTYHAKRDFTRTTEPEGTAAAGGGHSFVIQKHDARRLHYDLRLELDGVLKSWAVTKGPSLNPAEKRLAVQVEDHPLDYGGFEGTIPKGAYGGGTVIVWDRGTWAPVGDAAKGLQKGHLEFSLQGERLSGRWHLVRMKDGKNWLLMKADDAAASDNDVLERFTTSVATGRNLADIAAGRPPKRATRGGAKMPGTMAPMLATLAAAPRSGPDWVHEIKFDGYRLLVRVQDGQVRLFTRSGLDWTDRFTPVADAMRGLGDVWIDGEVVVENGYGSSDFSSLQADLSDRRCDRFLFYAFDLMWQDGTDLRRRPLEDRKALLETLLRDAKDPLRYSRHFDDDGALVLRHACRLSLEGVISKKRNSQYGSGRSRVWIKSKCAERQEFVIGGYTLSAADDGMIGSLVLGVNNPKDAGGLQYAGRVGTGFSHAQAVQLFGTLSGMAAKNPFAGKLTADQKRDVQFVTPVLVAEVEFRAWTANGHLRHAAFRGLREDKPADEIVAERPALPEARRHVRLTHPDRIYWPDTKITKADLADYYAQVWPRIAPYVTGRALSLLRAPTGIDGQTFFQKHPWKGMAKQIRQIPDPKDKEHRLIAIDDLHGLLALVQGAALELHPGGSRIGMWERPDRIVMDLDPGEGVGWDRLVEGALTVRAHLVDAGLVPFVKTSGGKGLHICCAQPPKATWATTRAFCHGIAKTMAKEEPDLYVATVTKDRRRGRIFIDYLRNQRGQTAVAPWSTRARAGAPVSMPLAWEELAPATPLQFTIADATNRLALPDPWADFSQANSSASPPEGSRSARR